VILKQHLIGTGSIVTRTACASGSWLLPFR
jgi:hypothetical protein